MPGSKGVLFLNPSSGSRMPPGERESFEKVASTAGLEIVPIEAGVDCPAIVRDRLRQGRRLAIAAGGDGTINSVVQALVHTDAALGVIPIGTYNHFAKDLGLPLTWRDALDVALGGVTKQIDAGRVNERFFVNNVTMGLYPELVRRREEKGREYPRWKARLHAVYATMQKYPHVAVTLESANHAEVVRTHMLMISNNTYDLSRIGVEAPRNTLEEGRLSVYWLPHVPRVQLTRFLAHYLAGRVRQAPGFRSFRTARVKVQSSLPFLQVGIDGEVATLTTPLNITTVPQSLLVKVAR